MITKRCLRTLAAQGNENIHVKSVPRYIARHLPFIAYFLVHSLAETSKKFFRYLLTFAKKALLETGSLRQPLDLKVVL